METLISRLPDDIRIVAKQRRAENQWNSQSDHLENAFGWSTTPEGLEYWNKIYHEYWDEDIPEEDDSQIEEDDQIIK